LNNADKNKKSWEFSESFRNIIFGLATCKNYELLLTILNEWGGSGSEESSEDDDFTDWYDILEIEPDATPEEIKKKYREMVKKYHPDKASSEEAEEYKRLFILIKKAYEILKDINKRNEFDEKRNNCNNK
jgi:preprotein translocase subunit Sec63